jgi:hypothetical protein
VMRGRLAGYLEGRLFAGGEDKTGCPAFPPIAGDKSMKDGRPNILASPPEGVAGSKQSALRLRRKP